MYDTSNTYFDSAAGERITKARAVREYDRHGHVFAEDDLVADMGDHETYDAQAVLAWLGY